MFPLLRVIVLMLLPTSAAVMEGCGGSGVKCVALPSSCTSDCNYLLKYKAVSDSTTQVEISGKTSYYNIASYTDYWLMFSHTTATSGMGGLSILACVKSGTSFSLSSATGYSWGVGSLSSVDTVGGLTGGYVDGVMTCSFTINNSLLPSTSQRLVYGMGRMSGSSIAKHSRTPSRSSQDMTLIQTFTSDPVQCTVPGVVGGSTSEEGQVDEGQVVTITCSSSYTPSTPTITCTTSGTFDTTNPTCNKDQVEEGVCADEGADGCYSNPSGCSSATCDFIARWWQEANFTQVSLRGKLSAFSLSSSDNIWLGFGLSELGTMKDSDMYLCSKVDSQYTAEYVMGFSHGLIQSSSVQLEDEVSGSLVDGVMTCNKTIPNSVLPSGALHIMAGMGTTNSDGEAKQHSKTPFISRSKYNLLSSTTDPNSSSFSHTYSMVCVLVTLVVVGLVYT